MELSVIVTAGGIGKRMGSELPKQFILVAGIPILQRSIKAFADAVPDAQILVTLPEQWISFWEDLCEQHNFRVRHEVVSGGIERYDSIKLALNKAHGKTVLVHDGVRPLVSKDVILNIINNVNATNGVIPVIPLKSSIRKGTRTNNEAVRRDEHWEVQTPQGFARITLEKAYEQPYTSDVTDDATLVERLGFSILMVDGDEKNLKITTPIDLMIAEKILES
tara:strand:+ start:230515 stop:231177 length:663 start_codon:yes stop_codon:yes gene_type:complete